MTQINLYCEKGGKESPKLRAKSQNFSTVFFRTKIWPYLGQEANNEENKGDLFSNIWKFHEITVLLVFINFGL